MNTDQTHENEILRLRSELERERREHRDTLLLLDAVTVARNKAEAALSGQARPHRRSRLGSARGWLSSTRA
jgi:hypothetical protein